MVDFVGYINWIYDFSNTQYLFSQLMFLYLLFLIVKSKNIFYSVLFTFLQLIFLGIFIAFYQMELYTGFFWVAEFSIFLVFLILLIYLNTDGYEKYSNFFYTIRFWYFLIILIPFFFLFKYNALNLPFNFLFDFNSLWDDYYEALSNVSTNDFNGLFNSYYVINSFEFLLFGLLLLFGTFLCVGIFKVFFIVKSIPYSSFFSIFNFFSLKINYNFLRQQNLHKQTSMPAVNRVIRKK